MLQSSLRVMVLAYLIKKFLSLLSDVSLPIIKTDINL